MRSPWTIARRTQQARQRPETTDASPTSFQTSLLAARSYSLPTADCVLIGDAELTQRLWCATCTPWWPRILAREAPEAAVLTRLSGGSTGLPDLTASQSLRNVPRERALTNAVGHLSSYPPIRT